MSTDVTSLPLGSRVVVRYLLDPRERAESGGPSMTDAVGILVAADDVVVTVETPKGRVSVERGRVVAAKVVPPRPVRRGAAHRAVSIFDLERVMVDSWPALEREPLGDWVLRAAGGYTNRANSVLSVGDPGVPVADALDRAGRWYAARGLPLNVALAGPAGFSADDNPVGRAVLEVGCSPHNRAIVMTSAAGELAAAADTRGVDLAPTLEPRWLAAYAATRRLVPGVTEQVLMGSPAQAFASVQEAGQLVGIARLGVAQGWGGLAAVWVHPEHRRRGVASRMSAALAAVAGVHGIRLLHLQVEAGNAAALAAYEHLGFAAHHEYVYLGRPLVTVAASSGP